MNKRKEMLFRLVTYVSEHHKKKIMEIVFKKKIPITRLLAYALDQELEKEKPFEHFTYRLPNDEMVEYSHIDEATKILQYMKNVEGLGIDQIISVRYDIGVPDIQSLLYGIRECVDKKMLEEYNPRVNVRQRTEYPKDYKFYRLTGTGPVNKRKIRKEINDMKRYERLKKKYANEKV